MDNREKMTMLIEAFAQADMAYQIIGKKYGLQYNSLMFLYLLSDHENVTQRFISEKFFMSKSTVHSIYLELEKKGLVTFKQGLNKKEKVIILTNEGKEFYAQIDRDTVFVEDAAIKAMGQDRFDMYLELSQEIAKELLTQVRDMEGEGNL